MSLVCLLSSLITVADSEAEGEEIEVSLALSGVVGVRSSGREMVVALFVLREVDGVGDEIVVLVSESSSIDSTCASFTVNDDMMQIFKTYFIVLYDL